MASSKPISQPAPDFGVAILEVGKMVLAKLVCYFTVSITNVYFGFYYDDAKPAVCMLFIREPKKRVL